MELSPGDEPGTCTASVRVPFFGAGRAPNKRGEPGKNTCRIGLNSSKDDKPAIKGKERN
jgi:hypothetical protein